MVRTEPKWKSRALYFCCALMLISPAWAQAPLAESGESSPPVPKASELLRGPLEEVGQAVASINPSHWRASGEVKVATQQNVDSIQKDLSATLPGLLAQADHAPSSVAAVFPVYRNIDALYDVLLRITQTASTSAPATEVSRLSSALEHLENGRTHLAETILATSKNTESRLASLQAAVQKAAAAQAAPPKTVVVDNGPAKATVRHKKKAAATSNNNPSTQQSAQPQQP
jgi:hypothetical protein